MGVFIIFLCGIFGGVLAELAIINDFKRDKPDEYPYWLKQKSYWIIEGLMILAGGFVVVLYSLDVYITPILAVNIGASAPLIIKGLTGGTGIPSKPEKPKNIN